MISDGDRGEAAQILRAVVVRGTGNPSARTPGYVTAGKTGTAQVVENGRYEPGEYVASFIGYVPAAGAALRHPRQGRAAARSLLRVASSRRRFSPPWRARSCCMRTSCRARRRAWSGHACRRRRRHDARASALARRTRSHPAHRRARRRTSITEIGADARATQPGSCSSPCAASTSTDTASSRMPSRRGAVVAVVEREVDVAVPQVIVDDTHLAVSRLADDVLRSSLACADRVRRNRDERQNDHDVPAARDRRGRRLAVRRDRHARRRARRADVGAREHDPARPRRCTGCWPRCSPAARGRSRWRSPRTRSRSVASRTSLPRRRTDQRHARPPRLSRHARALHRREAASLRPRGPRRAQRRRSRRPRRSPANCRRATTYAIDARSAAARDEHRAGGRRHALRGRRLGTRDRAAGPLQRRERAGGDRHGARGRHPRRSDRRAARCARVPFPGAWNASARSASRRSSIMRIRPTRSRTCCAPRARRRAAG